ncbi:MAG: glycosyltransferase, partial [Actinomycetota bacterium]|nr:glycosyltransferase [Actinomycetota bacterium]
VYPGPVGLLPLGVDTELFAMTGRAEDRRGVVSTVNQWGRERELHTYLRTRVPDFPIALYGERRGVSEQLAAYSRGPVSFFALPALYNQTAIVLDDFNHTTAAYGSVNSRVYEAAACGAGLMTNRSTGLDELGLGDVPVFGSPAEFYDLIHRDLESPAALEAAESRRRLVLDRHSYEARAAEFDEHVQRLAKRSDTEPEAARPIVTYFPDYRGNPYLEMMWSDLRRRRSVPVAVDNSLDFSVPLQLAGTGPNVFHINWTAPILGGGGDERSRLVRYGRFLEALDQMHGRGVGSIWTIHNVLPHECGDPVLEAQFRQELADRVDIVHVMCEATVGACSGRYEIPKSKARVLPHPSYIDVYPNLVDRQTARYELGLGTDDYVYLHFGQIRRYKGIDLLLDAFDRLARHRPEAKLLLVGAPGRFEGLDEIMQRVRANPSIVSNLNAVPDADVQLYLNAADVVVLPYLTALNSGALQLAYSFARPVIASEVGCVADQVDSSTGITFRWEDGRQSLMNAMLSAPDLGPEHSRAAHERAAANHYLDIGRGFSRLVEEAAEAGSRRRQS